MSEVSTALRPARQQPVWAATTDVAGVVEQLRSRPPLVTAASCYSLQRELSAVAAGSALVIQAGDCAERFHDATPTRVAARVDLLAHLADLVESATGKPVIRVGRMAGQYAKPRPQETERTPDGRILPVYRGDAVNSPEPDPQARVCDARRMLAAYDHAARTLDELFLTDLLPPFGGVDTPYSVTYAGHEALLLDYEQALVRDDDHRDGVYGSSGHFLWIGERTREVDGPHIAFAQRVTNPVGVKIGPDATGADVAELIARLATGRDPGRLSLIVRMGPRVDTELPRLLRQLDGLGVDARQALWLSDPMHGNTRRNRYGQKTRVLTDIVREIQRCHAVLEAHGLRLAGLHLETTPEPVRECVDHDADLTLRLDRYTSACDPRLNAEQAVDVVRAALASGWGRASRQEDTWR